MTLKNYTVFFDIFGKKLKTTTLAYNEDQAKLNVRSAIVFHKVVDESKLTPSEIQDIKDFVNELFK